MNKTFAKQELTTILNEFNPFINPHFLPIRYNLVGDSENKENVNNELENINLLINNTSNNNNSSSNLNNNFNKKINNENDNKIDMLNFSNIVNHENGGPQDVNSQDKIFLNKKRKKFDNINDNLLMIGLMHHGKKNLELVQQLWVNSRNVQEIRHRIKNLTCKRAPDNIIKNWKNLTESPLSKNEFLLFLKGLQWLGTKSKWSALSRYFLPQRTPDYLEK
jgi:hypothetical protein